MSIEKRLERVEAILDARGLDWDHPRVEDDHFAGANKMVADEPAKEPEHPAGPMPDPGKGYRILSKNPAEDLQRGDEYRCRREKQWIESNRVREGHRNQLSRLWYRRKIEVAKEPEPAKPPEPEYREPVLPADAAKECQFSDDGIKWRSGWLNGWVGVERSHQWIARSGVHWRHCRIKVDA